MRIKAKEEEVGVDIFTGRERSGFRGGADGRIGNFGGRGSVPNRGSGGSRGRGSSTVG